ncbi:MAG: hypothetical protein JWP95_1952 [Actinotalea sp.]|nr:hypothetical protein [Actinotalea sp.]
MASRREDLGSWLEGTPGDDGDDRTSGRRPRPRHPGTTASVPRRLAAVAVDWLLSLGVSAAFFPGDEPAVLPVLSGDPTATLAVFAVSTIVLVGTLGHTIGHRLLGIRIVRVRTEEEAAAGVGARMAAASPAGPTGSPGLVAALVRTGLLCLVIPAVVWDRTGRGLHDVAAGTAPVRR